MEWLVAVVAVAALGVAAIAAAGGMGQMSKEPVYDTYRQDLPDSPLTASEIDSVRFGVTLRGYAMGQVDDLLQRLGREIADRDARLAELTRLHGESVEDPPTVEQPVIMAPPPPPAVDAPPVDAPPVDPIEDSLVTSASWDRDEPPR